MPNRHTIKSSKLEKQQTLCRSLTVVKRPARASKSSRVRLRGLPTPLASLMASKACSKPSHRSQVNMVTFECPRVDTSQNAASLSQNSGQARALQQKTQILLCPTQGRSRTDSTTATHVACPNLQGSYNAWDNTEHSSVRAARAALRLRCFRKQAPVARPCIQHGTPASYTVSPVSVTRRRYSSRCVERPQIQEGHQARHTEGHVRLFQGRQQCILYSIAWRS